MSIAASDGQEFHEPTKIHWVSWEEWQSEESYEEDISSDIADHILHRILRKAI